MKKENLYLSTIAPDAVYMAKEYGIRAAGFLSPTLYRSPNDARNHPGSKRAAAASSASAESRRKMMAELN